MKIQYWSLFVVLLLLSQSCKSYRSNIILSAETEDINWKSVYEVSVIENPIRVGDKIQFSLYTNEGESIIDPSGAIVTKQEGDPNEITVTQPTYEVLESGLCLFPLIGRINVLGLKTSQLDSVLAAKYESYYNGVYVISKVVNKKIIVLGGKGGQIIPYTSNMNLLQALAIYGGLDDRSKGYNIRIVRGDLKNPEITIVNLSTVNDMKKTIVNLKPDDIIYIEPVRRPVAESVRDNLFIFNIIQVIVTTALLINNFAQ